MSKVKLAYYSFSQVPFDHLASAIETRQFVNLKNVNVRKITVVRHYHSNHVDVCLEIYDREKKKK